MGLILMAVGCSLSLDCEHYFVMLLSNIVQMDQNQYTNTLKYKETVRKVLMLMVRPKYSSEVTQVLQEGSSVRLFEY